MKIKVTDKKKYNVITAVDLRDAYTIGNDIMGKVTLLFRDGKKDVVDKELDSLTFQKEYGFVISLGK